MKIFRCLIISLVTLFCCGVGYAQPVTLDSYVGTWQYRNPTSGEEFTIQLKKGREEIPAIFGGGWEDCLIGAYLHKKNGMIAVDCLSYLKQEKEAFYYPICLTSSRGRKSVLNLKIDDYNMRNPKGEYKVIGMFSKVYYLSSSPAQIRMEIDPDGQEMIYLNDDEVFPRGTSLPKNIILTKIE